MIERQYGKIALSCDEECGDHNLDFHDPDDFDVMIDEAKSDGWRIFKWGGEWKHICPFCDPQTANPKDIPDE